MTSSAPVPPRLPCGRRRSRIRVPAGPSSAQGLFRLVAPWRRPRRLGEVVRLKPTSIAEAAEWWSDLAAQVEVTAELGHPTAGAGLMAYGSFLFDPANSAGRSSLIVPQTVVGRRNGQVWMTEIGPVSAEVVESSRPTPAERPRNVTFGDGGLSGPEWEAAVAEAVRRIGDGKLEKVVLARDLLAFAENDIDLRWIAARLAETMPNAGPIRSTVWLELRLRCW